MDIIFSSTRVEKMCHRATGKLKTRLDDIQAARDMAQLKTLPGRLHPLTENRKGQWSIDLKHPKRLILEPVGDPLPKNKDGRLFLEKIYIVRILGVEDTHGKRNNK